MGDLKVGDKVRLKPSTLWAGEIPLDGIVVGVSTCECGEQLALVRWFGAITSFYPWHSKDLTLEASLNVGGS